MSPATRLRGHRPRPVVLRRRSAVEQAMVALAADRDSTGHLERLSAKEWAHVPAVAEFHGLTLLLNAALVEGIDAPPQIRNQVADWSRRAAMADLRTEAELAAVAEALDSADCRWLTFKGPALAAHVYRGPNLRTYGDLDLLVDVDSLATAIDSLIDFGANQRENNFALMTSLDHAELTLDLPGGTEIDLHWHPVAGRARDRFHWPPGELLDRRRRVLLAPSGCAVFVADPTDQLLMVATHHTLAGNFKLIWCRDILEIVANDPPDWAVLIERAQRWNIAMPVAAALRRAALTVGAQVPVEVIDTLSSGGWWAVLTALEAVAPAGLAPDRSLKGRHPVGATRDTTAASLAALARGLYREHWQPTNGRTPQEHREPHSTREDWITAAQASEARVRG